jgi:hypothetical protein
MMISRSSDLLGASFLLPALVQAGQYSSNPASEQHMKLGDFSCFSLFSLQASSGTVLGWLCEPLMASTCRSVSSQS